MSSDHFQHHHPHHALHEVPLTGHGATLVHVTGLTDHHTANTADAIPNVTTLRDTATNLNTALLGHYQALIEGHGGSIRPGSADT